MKREEVVEVRCILNLTNKKHMKWDNIKMTSISYEHRNRNASVDNHYLVATLRTPGQQGDVGVLDEGDVAVGLLGDLVLKC